MGTSFSSFANEPEQRDEPPRMDDELVDVEDETLGNDNTTGPVDPQVIRDIQGIPKSVELEFADDIMLAIIYNILAHDFTHDYGSNMNDRLNGIVHVIVKLNVYSICFSACFAFYRNKIKLGWPYIKIRFKA